MSFTLFKKRKPRKQVILSKMFAKIVIGVLLVSVLPCESKNQRFIEVPFDDGTSIQNTQQLTSQSPQIHNAFVGAALNEKSHITRIAPNQHFASNEQQFQGNFHNHALRNNHIMNPIITNSRHQSIATEEEVMPNSVIRARFQDGIPAFHGHREFDLLPVNQVSDSTRRVPAQASPEAHLTSSRDVPSSATFTRSQPIQSFGFGDVSAQPIHNSKFSHGTEPPHTRQFDATLPSGSNTQSDYQLLNSVANSKPSKQPVNTFLGVEEPTFRFIQQPAEEPQKTSEDVSNIAHFIQRAQPAIRAPISPPSQQSFNSQLPQLNRQQVSQNPRFPERPELLINVQPDVPTRSRFLVNQAAPAAHEVLRRPNSNLVLQNQNNQDLEEQVFRQQAESAKYSFASQIDDSINGNQHQREEVRDGLSVKGMYSYSDGYVKRTVFYEADENGYRVVREEEEPVGNGPQVNPKGQANVSSYVAGNTVQYSITADDIQENRDIAAQERRI